MLNVKNFMGKSTTSYSGWIKVISFTAIVPVVWFLFLSWLIPIWLMILVSILLGLRLFLYFVLDEKKQIASYEAIENSQYTDVKEMLQVSSIYEDGIITFSDGRMIKMLIGEFKLFNDDDKFSEAYERFLLEIPTDYDEIYKQAKCKDFFYKNASSVKVWQDVTVKKQRFNYYKEQAELYGYRSLAFELILVLRVSNSNLDKIKRFETFVREDKPTKNLFASIRPVEAYSEIKEILSNDLNITITDEDLLPKIEPIRHKNIIVGSIEEDGI